MKNLVAYSKSNQEVRNALFELIATLLECDVQLPEELIQLTCSYLRNEPKQTSKRESRKQETVLRNIGFGLIAKMVADKFDLHPTRNEVSASVSACDVVAKAASKILTKRVMFCFSQWSIITPF